MPQHHWYGISAITLKVVTREREREKGSEGRVSFYLLANGGLLGVLLCILNHCKTKV